MCIVVFCIVTTCSLVDYCQHFKKERKKLIEYPGHCEVDGSIIFLYDII